MLKTDYDKFSVTTLTERGETFERINEISLNVNCFPIVTIKYHNVNEHNAPCDSLRVTLFYSDILADGIEWFAETEKFLKTNIGCVTKSHSDRTYCDNLLLHAINEFWLMNEHYFEMIKTDACDYYPKTYNCYQYDEINDKTGREIIVRIQ